MMENGTLVVIRQFTKTKVIIYAHTSKEEENNFILYLLSTSHVCPFPGEWDFRIVEIALECKH